MQMYWLEGIVQQRLLQELLEDCMDRVTGRYRNEWSMDDRVTE